MSERIPCTVEILTHNSAATLRRALESVKDFSEVIIIDGNSTDATHEIAKEYGARIITQDKNALDSKGKITNFAVIRNQGLDAATQPWFFFLDSDEYLSDELIAEIRTITERNEPAAYWILREYVWHGRRIECNAAYPNRNMRLFHRDAVLRFKKPVHERIEVRPGARVLQSTAALLVPVLEDIQGLRQKSHQYIAIEMERNLNITLREWVRLTFRNAAVSGLYIWRLLRNTITCRGAHLPLAYEFERHRYHILLSTALLGNLRKHKTRGARYRGTPL